MAKHRVVDSMVKPIILPPVAAPAPAPAADPALAKYDFGHTRRCPRCGSLQTWLDGVDGATGFRTCRVAICRHRWKVSGRPI